MIFSCEKQIERRIKFSWNQNSNKLSEFDKNDFKEIILRKA